MNSNNKDENYSPFHQTNFLLLPRHPQIFKIKAFDFSGFLMFNKPFTLFNKPFRLLNRAFNSLNGEFGLLNGMFGRLHKMNGLLNGWNRLLNGAFILFNGVFRLLNGTNGLLNNPKGILNKAFTLFNIPSKNLKIELKTSPYNPIIYFEPVGGTVFKDIPVAEIPDGTGC